VLFSFQLKHEYEIILFLVLDKRRESPSRFSGSNSDWFISLFAFGPALKKRSKAPSSLFSSLFLERTALLTASSGLRSSSSFLMIGEKTLRGRSPHQLRFPSIPDLEGLLASVVWPKLSGDKRKQHVTCFARLFFLSLRQGFLLFSGLHAIRVDDIFSFPFSICIFFFILIHCGCGFVCIFYVFHLRVFMTQGSPCGNIKSTYPQLLCYFPIEDPKTAVVWFSSVSRLSRT